MTKVHYFQRYSQKENVVTNNTLLLFSRLQADQNELFQDVLNKVLDQESITVGATFREQTSGKNTSSIPDGIIEQDSFKIVIETKVDSGLKNKQLKDHLEAFDNEETQILLALTKKELDSLKKVSIETRISEYDNKVGVYFATFQELLDALLSSVDERNYELWDIVTDYENFCLEEELLSRAEYKMRAVPCGKTLDENFKYDLYYQPADRSFRDYPYLGIYSNKIIQGIGKITKKVEASFENEKLEVYSTDCKSELSKSERERIINAIIDGEKRHGWSASGRRLFILVDKFYKTKFEKSSKWGMANQQYFDLGEILDLEELPPVEEMAKQLKGKTWK